MEFKLVMNCKRALEFTEINCHLAWNRFIAKYELDTAPSYLNLNNRFESSALVLIDDDPDEWITELESLRTQIDDIKFLSPMTDMNLSSLPKDYDMVLCGLQSRLLKSGHEEPSSEIALK